jgi:hypothetical protein
MLSKWWLESGCAAKLKAIMLLIPAETDLENIMLNKRSQPERTT